MRTTFALQTRSSVGESLVLALIGVLAIAVTGCKNSGSQSAAATGGTAAVKSFGGSAGGTLPSSGSEAVITINRVVRSNLDPNSYIELISSDDQIGNYCSTVNDCDCVFNFIEPSSGIPREVFQTPSRVENNMLRCLFTQVATDAAYFDVRISVKAASQTSDSERVFLNAANPSINASLASNYTQVQRYQCRDLLDRAQNTSKYRNGTLVDPRIWDLSLPFNFYTTSFGRDYGAIPDASSPGAALPYECPLTPNDRSANAIYDLTLYSLAPIDLRTPDIAGVSSGDNTIFPSDDNLIPRPTTCVNGSEPECEKFRSNRHDFYVSNFRSGIFRESVCLIHRVSNYASQTLDCEVHPELGPVVVGNASVGRDVIGFAAVPDQNQACPGPSVVTLPPGKKWAKVWQFRTSYDQRTVEDLANPNDIGQLHCTIRERECIGAAFNAAGGNSVCSTDGMEPRSFGGPTLGFQQSAQLGTTLSDPGFGNCDELGTAGDGNGSQAGGFYQNFPTGTACRDTTTGVNCCQDWGITDATNTTNRPANFTPGGQWCNPSLVGSNRAQDDGGLAQDVWLLGNGGRRACVEADTDASGRLKNPGLPNPNPFIYSPRTIDQDSKFDIVYVVTPPDVTLEQMQDPQNNARARQFTPQRIKPGTTNQFQVYNLYSGSNNSNNAAQRLSRFPLCILQDANQQGAGP
ncbi:MAG: hypothetical protein AB1540_05780 [Bdellovibrionota bacterium]